MENSSISENKGNVEVGLDTDPISNLKECSFKENVNNTTGSFIKIYSTNISRTIINDNISDSLFIGVVNLCINTTITNNLILSVIDIRSIDVNPLLIFSTCIVDNKADSINIFTDIVGRIQASSISGNVLTTSMSISAKNIYLTDINNNQGTSIVLDMGLDLSNVKINNNIVIGGDIIARSVIPFELLIDGCWIKDNKADNIKLTSNNIGSHLRRTDISGNDVVNVIDIRTFLMMDTSITKNAATEIFLDSNVSSISQLAISNNFLASLRFSSATSVTSNIISSNYLSDGIYISSPLTDRIIVNDNIFQTLSCIPVDCVTARVHHNMLIPGGGIIGFNPPDVQDNL